MPGGTMVRSTFMICDRRVISCAWIVLEALCCWFGRTYTATVWSSPVSPMVLETPRSGRIIIGWVKLKPRGWASWRWTWEWNVGGCPTWKSNIIGDDLLPFLVHGF